MKKITVFAPVGALDHEPGILNAVHCFAEAGYKVHVLGVRNRFYEIPRFESPNVQISFLPFQFNSERESRVFTTILFTLWVLATFWRRHPIIFAGGLRALVAAYAYSLVHPTKIINYQTELYVSGRLDGRFVKVVKAIERQAASRSSITIEHSEDRRRLLAADLGIRPDTIMIVPNAPSGGSMRYRSDFLSRRLGLGERVKILLNPGTLSEHFETSKVVRAAQTLPPEWHCVLHSIRQRSANDPYLRQLQALDANSRVTFSLRPVPYRQVTEVLGSARIGIALYSADYGENYAAVGLASGKLCHFLKLAIPVIVSPLEGLGDFVTDRRIGEVLVDPLMLGELVAKIDAEYDRYCERAAECFEAELSYDRRFQSVLRLTDEWSREFER